jgi:hypothetical protein
VLALCIAYPASAQELANVCHASSSYDLTILPASIVFDRADDAPRKVTFVDGRLQVEGANVSLRPDQQDQLALFDSGLRALLPRLRRVADHGVDVAAASVRAELVTRAPEALADGELDRRLRAHVTDLHARIARSNSTHDWLGDAFDRYANDMSADLLPLVAGSLTNEAVQMAMTGDLQGAADLRDRASSLASGLPERVRQAVDGRLRPEIRALCPDIRRLAELQDGLTDARGRSLQLLSVEP